MIIDVILDRRADVRDGRRTSSESVSREMEQIGYYAKFFGFDYISKAVSSRDNREVRKSLCRYIDENGYSQSYKSFVNSQRWVA